MEAWEVLLVIGLFVFVGAVFALVVWGFVHVKKRDGRTDEQQADLVGFAGQRNWSYTPVVHGGADRYCGTAPFPPEGAGLDVWDHIAGGFRGRSFRCLEYRSRDGGTDTNRQWRYYTVFAMTTPAPAPRTSVHRPKPMERLDARLFGGLRGSGKPVQLGLPEFDEAFLTVTDDQAFARDVVAGHLAEFLLSDPRAKDAPVQFHGDELITWYEGRLRPERIEPHLDYLCAVLDRVPAPAWQR